MRETLNLTLGVFTGAGLGGEASSNAQKKSLYVSYVPARGGDRHIKFCRSQRIISDFTAGTLLRQPLCKAGLWQRLM